MDTNVEPIKTTKRGPYQKSRTKCDDAAVRVALSAGSVTLTFKGNLFDLTPAERQLIGDLTDVIRRYEQPNKES